MVEHYGDDKAPMQLRMLAEAVYGMGSMGQNGAGMRKMIPKALMEHRNPHWCPKP
jgi:splicing suppressor protein 51